MLEETSDSLLYVQFWREFCLSNLEKKKKKDFGSQHQNSVKENLLDSVRFHPLARLLIECTQRNATCPVIERVKCV